MSFVDELHKQETERNSESNRISRINSVVNDIVKAIKKTSLYYNDATKSIHELDGVYCNAVDVPLTIAKGEDGYYGYEFLSKGFSLSDVEEICTKVTAEAVNMGFQNIHIRPFIIKHKKHFLVTKKIQGIYIWVSLSW